MKRILLVFGIVALMMGANSAFAQTQTCAMITGGNAGGGRGVSPTYLANQDGRANQGCTILITLNANGSIATTFPNPATSYDNGLDDNLIGVVNNTSKTITALQLSASVPIFGLEDDGVCAAPPGWTFSPLGPNPNCAIATDPHRYGPAGINFTIFNPNSGIVNFGNGGIAPSSNAFFSLEGAHLTKIVAVVVPGLAISKQVSVVGGGPALPGAQLDYLVHVTNPSNNPPNFAAPSVVITDDLSSAGAGRLTFVNPAPTMNGATTGVTVVGSVLKADYSTPNGLLQPGQSIDVRFRVQIAAAVPAGTTLTNTALVTWNTPTQTASASASIDVAQTSPPNLVLTKTGPATMNPGQLGQFGLNVQNTGVTDAWNATILDRLPTGATGGMCSTNPQVVGAQVFQADGVTPVAGKGPLVAGTDFSIGYNQPTCELTLTTLTAAAAISQNQRLIINYRTQLDANSQNGATLTNIAGAIQWFDGNSTTANRKTFTGPLTNGTPGILDNQDAHTVTVAVPGLTISKQVSVVGGGAALPGGQLDYLVHVTNASTSAATTVVITDDLSSAGAGRLTFVNPAATMNGSTTGVTVAGSVLTADYSTSNGPLQPGQSIDVRFRTQIAAGLTAGTTLTNTALVTWNSPTQTASASASIDIGGTSTPNLVLTKTGPATMNPGQLGQFGLNVQNTGVGDAWNATILDRLPTGTSGGMCSTNPQVVGAQVFQADGVTPVAGKGPLVAGTDFSVSYSKPTCELTLTMLTAAAIISQNQRLIINYRTQLDANSQNGATLTNIAGAIQWFDGDPSVPTRQGFTHTVTDGTPGVLDFQDAHTVTVGVPGLAITKQLSVVGGGAALPGGQLDYLVHVTNASTTAATTVVITDDLSSAGAGRLTFVNPAATMNGSTTGVTVIGSALTADYSTSNGPLQPGQSIDVRFRAQIAAGLTAGTTLTNTGVVTWNTPQQTASASASIDIGGTPGSGMLNGTVWHDANFNKTLDTGEPLLQGWTVGLHLNGVLLQSVVTDVNGVYHFAGIAPTNGTDRYELRFTAPGAGPNTAKLGKADSAFTNNLQQITDIVLPSGSNLQNLNLPIAPNGVVYNSGARTPVFGATLTLLNAGSASPLPAACFDDPAQQGQITLASGYYKFDINFSDPACPSGGDYLIGVTAPPGTSYVAGYSQIIPPTSNASTAAFSVPTCPGSVNDAIPGTALFCEAQPSEFPPAASIAPRSAGTAYYARLRLDGSRIPGTSQIFNNHIPLDPQLAGSLAISKTTPLLNVTRGQQVPYTITVNNLAEAMLTDVSIVDRIPAGFSYVKRSALLDGVQTEPSVVGNELRWNGLTIADDQARTLKLLLIVGAGVTESEYVNRAQAVNTLNGIAMSGEATATVRVTADPTFDCTDVTGKVFNDGNRNGSQDDGEKGLAGVRVVTPTGLEATTDQHGRYHITCAITPYESRGSNFVMKIDDRTLPSGYRLTTNQVQIQRATRGKALQMNFGASIYRVVGIDLSDAVFEPGTTEIRVQWRPRLNTLLEEVRKAPSVLRLSYIADTEDAALVDRRMEVIKRQLTKDAATDSQMLTIEPEVFWRLGGPPKRLNVPVPGSR
ncbi:MAG: SdrD B-like domain-containing protein [Terriglobales bacterium]